MVAAVLAVACRSTVQVTEAPAGANDSGIVEPSADPSNGLTFSRVGWKTEFSSASVPLSRFGRAGRHETEFHRWTVPPSSVKRPRAAG